MNYDSRGKWAPLTGVAFVVLGVAVILGGGEPPDPTNAGGQEIARFYDDHATAQTIYVSGTVLCAGLLVFFGAVVRDALRAAQPDVSGDLLPAVALAGTVIFATGLAFDATLTMALLDTSDDISPAATQSLSALFANDFLLFATGMMLFLGATGLSALRHGALPRWLAVVLVALALVSFTPAGFVGFMGGLAAIVVISVLLTLRGRRGGASSPAAAAA